MLSMLSQTRKQPVMSEKIVDWTSQVSTLIVSYIGSNIFGVQNFEFQYLLGFHKNEYFLGVC